MPKQVKEIVVIEPRKKLSNYWNELWSYRELFYFLAWRDIAVRYKQTVVGIAWSVVRPVITIAVFSVIFGKVAALPSEGIPYVILVTAATLPWQLFSTSLTESTNSLVNSAGIISKVYFPRLTIPLSSIVMCLVDFAISLVILALLMVYYGVVPGKEMLMLPVFTLIAVMASFGAGLWFSALNVKYRDIKHIVPFIVQFGIYVSPVGFSSTVVPEKWRLLYSLNPMVGVIDGFRWAITGGKSYLYMEGLYLSLIVILVILVTGFLYFRKTERTFVDVI